MIKKQILLPGIFTLLFCTALFSQTTKDYREGEIMVQLHNQTELDNLIKEYSSWGLENISTVSARFSIYLLKFDNSKTNNLSLISQLKKSKSVVNVQNNHFIEFRELEETLPDDPLFPDQWALKNTGQNGGLIDADIDAPEAWDITKGGLTVFGDTIAVAIIDGGTDLNHEDIDLWKNRQEIPNNNIDDDENGYVDDFDGWNAYNNSGDIPLHNHGVHVGGIAGARGNNSLGISGINWHLKTLPVAGDATVESIVVNALSYVYVVRERYDQTNGQEGAFIVADNCSFGVNEGQPEDFPIWEAMYDSLGKLGILSMGATANAPWDIDSVGDIPTAFSTDYMISVTNTTKLDKLYVSAAWGDTTIDLGAPGTSIVSLFINNNYGSKSGTSMATPHVTGSAALLMSAADSAFLTYYKKNPGPASLMIKHYLLEGTDPIDDLQGKTVTGGRLNVNNALNIMLFDPLPFLLTDKDSVNVEVLVNSYLETVLNLVNGGGDTLFYSIADLPGWLTINAQEGYLLANESKEIILTFSSSEIDTGTYQTVIHINTNTPVVKDIKVEMKVFDNVGTDYLTVTDSEIKIFPNPFYGGVNFSFNLPNNYATVIEIFDVAGRKIFSFNQILSGQETITWEDKHAEKGVYYYKILTNGELLKTGKLIKL